MIGYIYGSMLKEMMRPKRLIGWLIVLLAIVGISSYLATQSGQPDALQNFKQLNEEMMFRVIALISAVLSTAVLSAEVEQRTVVYLLVRPIKRPVLLLSRTFASMTVVALFGIVLVLGASFAVYGSKFLANSYLGPSLLAVVFGAYAYGALFVAISLVLNRALIYCLLFAFGWELLLPNMPGDAYYASVLTHMKGIADIPSPPADPDSFIGSMQNTFAMTFDVPRQTAVLVLAIVPTLLLVLSAWWFNTQEFVPREDAE